VLFNNCECDVRVTVCDGAVAADEEADEMSDEEEGEQEMYDDDDVDDEPYFPYELTSPQPIYEYGRDVSSPRTVSEPTPDCSRASSELTFSQCVVVLLLFKFQVISRASLWCF